MLHLWLKVSTYLFNVYTTEFYVSRFLIHCNYIYLTLLLKVINIVIQIFEANLHYLYILDQVYFRFWSGMILIQLFFLQQTRVKYAVQTRCCKGGRLKDCKRLTTHLDGEKSLCYCNDIYFILNFVFPMSSYPYKLIEIMHKFHVQIMYKCNSPFRPSYCLELIK